MALARELSELQVGATSNELRCTAHDTHTGPSPTALHGTAHHPDMIGWLHDTSLRHTGNGRALNLMQLLLAVQ